ncbi:ribonuclease D [Thermophilibacter provencensis]|uniref:Ribonuclease D n=1 Tax=Thermophilibacter provencensis TaxID=1852386 RepID=A0ABT7V553_9ACTN|nr:ribonuclease D [Thermophilibacter provencensis]MDM8271727.1 ribonuclease D [Thermophilibacter provencensis]
MYLSTQDELIAFCERAATSKVLAVDTEFLRERTFFPKLCLVQVAAGNDIAAIDPISIEDLSPLAALLESPSITKVFHACTQDLEVLYDGMGVMCAPVFDTQLVAAFLGMRQQVSYGSLVEAYCGVHLAKAESLTDWSRRPLDPEQLTYAEDDVRYLPGIYDQMMSALIEKDRLSWVKPEMERLCDASRICRDPRDAYQRLKRASSLTRRQLAIAREVCAWREGVAAERDIPRKWVMSDEVIVEVCKRAPSSPERLRRIRNTEQLSEGDARSLVEAVSRGASCPAEECPKMARHARPSAEAEGVVDLMYAVLRLVSEKSGVATQLIATRDDLLEFLQDRGSSRLASGWRWELAGRTLAQLLSGEVGLTVKSGRIELL